MAPGSGSVLSVRLCYARVLGLAFVLLQLFLCTLLLVCLGSFTVFFLGLVCLSALMLSSRGALVLALVACLLVLMLAFLFFVLQLASLGNFDLASRLLHTFSAALFVFWFDLLFASLLVFFDTLDLAFTHAVFSVVGSAILIFLLLTVAAA